MKENPKKTKADIAHSIAKVGFSSIPIVGGSASEIFAQIITSQLEKRRDEWIESIANHLLKLEKKIDNFEIINLSENEEFITCLIYASQVALRNHQKDKIESLKNIVLNEALSINIEQDKKLMFIKFIDDLTPSHLKLLWFLNNPKKWGADRDIKYPEWSTGGVGSVIEFSINEFKGNRDFYDQLGKDLYARGLLISESFHGTVTVETMFSSKTTSLGVKFIEYISNPVLRKGLYNKIL